MEIHSIAKHKTGWTKGETWGFFQTRNQEELAVSYLVVRSILQAPPGRWEITRRKWWPSHVTAENSPVCASNFLPAWLSCSCTAQCSRESWAVMRAHMGGACEACPVGGGLRPWVRPWTKESAATPLLSYSHIYGTPSVPQNWGLTFLYASVPHILSHPSLVPATLPPSLGWAGRTAEWQEAHVWP